jgi:hypothetical protein
MVPVKMENISKADIIGKMCFSHKKYFVEFENEDVYDVVCYPTTKPFVVLGVDWMDSKQAFLKVLCFDGRIGKFCICWNAIDFAR